MNKKEVFLVAMSQVLPFRLMFGCLFLVSVTMTLLGTFQPYAIKLLVDSSEQSHSSSLLRAFIFLGILSLSLMTLNRVQALLGLYLYPKLRAHIISHLFKSVSRKPYVFFSQKLSGNIADRIRQLSNFYVEIINSVVFSVFNLLISLGMANYFLSTVNIKLVGYVYLWLIIHTLISIAFYPKAMLKAKKEQQVQSEVNGKLTNYVNNFMLLLVVGASKRVANTMRGHFDHVATIELKTGWIFEFMRLLQDIFAIGLTIIVLLQLYYLSSQQKISLGDASMAFILVGGVVSTFYNVYEQFYTFFVVISKSQDNIDYLQLKREYVSRGERMEPNSSSLLVKNMSYAYLNGEKLFNHFSLTIHPGEKIAITGPNGCGKSTLLYLLMGLIQPALGRVELGGVELFKLPPEVISNYLTIIPQHKFLFNDTVMENLKLAAPLLSEEEIKQRVEALGFAHSIEKLTKGYETEVSEGSNNLSGGQRQIIGLLQGVMQETPIIMIDEPFNMLDPQTSKNLFEKIMAICSDKTLIVVTHEVRQTECFDRIIQLG